MNPWSKSMYFLNNKNSCSEETQKWVEEESTPVCKKPVFYLVLTLFLLEKNYSVLRLFSFVFLFSAFPSVEIPGTIWFSIINNKTTMLVFSSCCNKLLQASWLKMMDIFSITFVKSRHQKSVSLGQNQGVSGATIFFRNCRGESVPAFSTFWWPPAFLVLWVHHSSLPDSHLQISLCCLCIACICVYNFSLPSFYKNTGDCV